MPEYPLPVEPPYIFISYASRDRAQARRVVDALEAAGVRAWFDQRAIEGGTDYGPEIVHGIRHAQAFILMCSPASLASKNVRQEIHLAWHYGRPYLPLTIEPVTLPDDVIYWLQGTQRIDILDHPEHEWLPRILRALVRFGAVASETSQPMARAHAVAAAETATAPITNLPAPTTSFIGRGDELLAIGELLRGHRLVTLTGAGGAGKTRLAIEIGRDHLGRFSDGVWLVELAALTEPALVPQAVADVFGIREQPGQELLAAIAAALARREALLILDNCEHLVEAAGALAAQLLVHAPALKLLVTSREPLNVTGEALYRVPTLTLPDVSAPLTLAATQASDAARLFVERAALSKPGFALTDANAATVSRICHSLDGIPLALELAAARVKVLALEQIESRLADRFRLLTGGSRDALPHHQTLRQTIDWSYDLLDETQQRLFRRLSVFAGGCVLEQVELICGGDGIDQGDILDLIAQLVDRSLVVTEDRGDTLRYRMLESIREYAAEQLRADDADGLARRHAAAFSELAEEAAAHLRGPQQLVRMRRLHDELDNIRAAISWALLWQPDVALRLAAALRWYWEMRSLLSEGRRWLDAALAWEGGPADVRAEVRNGSGKLALLQGDFAYAERCFAETRAELGALDDLVTLDTLYHLSSVAIHQGDTQHAQEFLDQCLPLAEEQHHSWWAAAVLLNLAITEGVAGALDTAGELLTRSLAICHAVGDQWLTSICLSNLATVAGLQGDVHRQAVLLQDGIEHFAAIGDMVGITDCLWSLGVAALRNGQPGSAARLFGASQGLAQAVGSPVTAINQGADEQNLRDARELLGEDVFRVAWAEGERMSLPDALAEARLVSDACHAQAVSS
jgi:non-specific serine/threonine protein kinase